MAAGRADRRNRLAAKFVGKLPQLVGRQPTQIVGSMHGVEQRGLRIICHQTGLSQQIGGVDCNCLPDIGCPIRSARQKQDMFTFRWAESADLPSVSALMDRAIATLPKGYL